MNPLFLQVLAPLLQYLPDLAEAGKIVFDKDTRKDNAGSKSTAVAKAGLGAATVMLFDPDTPPEVLIATLLASLALYFYRRKVKR
ncbi:MAG: hypothetical protein CMI02_07430 [Oceanospirillaceae bacterium]|nr:hypothetical protein [Oceanospirillaceae bacterium]|tara:strand:- start:229 stop:483 length:255 start_codon:yes stop_codon:yes gene_type:complete